MDIVLGVSLTPKTVRMVLVEGARGDGEIVDHDTFDVMPSDGAATQTASAEVVAAVLGTLESAREGGHQLKAIGVAWSDHAEAAELRDALAANGIEDAFLVSELHAAGALAQTAGRAVGYESTGLLFLHRDTATLSVVRTDDGSIVKVLSRSLHSTDAMAVLTEMAAAVTAQDSPPQGLFVVGSGIDVASVKSHLQTLVDIPVNAPEESGLALARGAALAAASAPIFDASTVGLAYSQDPDGLTAGNDHPGLAAADTEVRPLAAVGAPLDAMGLVDSPAEEGRKPFLLVGSALTSVFVIGVIALVISLAVSIRPTADQRPDPGQAAIIPSALPPSALPPAAPPVPVVAPPPAPAVAPPAPAPETIKAPIPVVQQEPAPKRQVYVAPPAAPAPEPPAAVPDPPAAPPAADPIPADAPPVVPPVRAPWQQQYQQQYPQQYPQQQYPQQYYPQYPQQQYPQYPQQQYPPYPGYGSGGYGGGGRPQRNCFLIFCGPAHR